ncbi:hypothetical protein SteCoe_15839 [Stentor coeruleus]|uniref:Tubulin--tyrosine ligase-like protein 5 n=1 Tax=Stentor coeruleus TaxID=5963 RepID=A0A1R2C2J1_9CILI|nr:hypothetical protein SteCoe_15839 [Stentor coeruleus]
MNYNRKKSMNSPELTVTKCGTGINKPNTKHTHIDIKTIGYPGQGLHSFQSTPILENLHNHFSMLSLKLGDSEDFKPPLITLTPITEDQLIKDTVPTNTYSKGNSGSTHQLLYKIFKADAKLIRSVLESSGFFYTESHSWNLLWSGSSPQEFLYEDLNPYQKINHFPSSNELTRKDKLCINMTNMQEKYSKEAYDFIPETYVLPEGFPILFNRFNSDKKNIWIVKPANSSQGRGIFLVDSIQNVPLDEMCVISKYIDDPYLINGLKFDIRLYVCVTSFEPLRVYLYEEGLTRFASEKYVNEFKDNKFIHLTNYSVNKKNENFVQNANAKDDGVGHKWSLTALMKYFKEKNIDVDGLWQKIYDLVIKSVLSIESQVVEASKRLNLHRNNCFNLFGFDVIVDSSLKPWLLEVNLSPSMATESPLDFYIKSNLLTDTFNLIGIHMKPARKVMGYKTCTRLTAPKLKNSPYLVPKLPKKHYSSKKVQEILRETLDEYSRKKGFLRLYPCKNGHVYDQYFTQARPINKIINSVLFDENTDLKILESPSSMKPLPIYNKANKKLSVDNSIDTKSIKTSKDTKLILNGDDLLIEYLQRVIRILKDKNEIQIPAGVKVALERFSSHFTWKMQESSEVNIAKKLENRIQEMLSRKRSVKLQQRYKNWGKTLKSEAIHEFSDEEVSEMLLNCNKDLALELINFLFEGDGVLLTLKAIKLRPNPGVKRVKTPVFFKEYRAQTVPKRPNTSVRLKFVF